MTAPRCIGVGFLFLIFNATFIDANQGPPSIIHSLVSEEPKQELAASQAVGYASYRVASAALWSVARTTTLAAWVRRARASQLVLRWRVLPVHVPVVPPLVGLGQGVEVLGGKVLDFLDR